MTPALVHAFTFRATVLALLKLSVSKTISVCRGQGTLCKTVRDQTQGPMAALKSERDLALSSPEKTALSSSEGLTQ
ncbi:hypothetical protein VNO77_27729 [Canavalia gladiata]|uniref:Secreted protein n=1 Tax=Canavalia gladiata TaxID=3824 RepID=A0AAN9KZE3_CANGL